MTTKQRRLRLCQATSPSFCFRATAISSRDPVWPRRAHSGTAASHGFLTACDSGAFDRLSRDPWQSCRRLLPPFSLSAPALVRGPAGTHFETYDNRLRFASQDPAVANAIRPARRADPAENTAAAMCSPQGRKCDRVWAKRQDCAHPVLYETVPGAGRHVALVSQASGWVSACKSGARTGRLNSGGERWPRQRMGGR